MSTQCSQLSSLLVQKNSGNNLNANSSHPRCSIYLPALSYKSMQYFTASKIRNDSWNCRLAASSDNFNPIMLQFIHMKYKTIKKTRNYILFLLSFYRYICLNIDLGSAEITFSLQAGLKRLPMFTIYNVVVLTSDEITHGTYLTFWEQLVLR